MALLGDRLATRPSRTAGRGSRFRCRSRHRELAIMDLGVMALGVVPARGSFNGTGTIGTSFQAGGVEFTPGRFVYCDADGVVVSSRRLHDL